MKSAMQYDDLTWKRHSQGEWRANIDEKASVVLRLVKGGDDLYVGSVHVLGDEGIAYISRGNFPSEGVASIPAAVDNVLLQYQRKVNPDWFSDYQEVVHEFLTAPSQDKS